MLGRSATTGSGNVGAPDEGCGDEEGGGGRGGEEEGICFFIVQACLDATIPPSPVDVGAGIAFDFGPLSSERKRKTTEEEEEEDEE